MRKGKLISGALLAAAALVACLNTLPAPKFSAVTVTVQASGTAVVSAEPLTLVKRLERSAADLLSVQEAGAYIPSIVSNVRLTVTAADMATIMKTENAAGLDSVDISVNVPIGPARNFLVQGLSSSGAVAFTGQVVADLTGAPVTVPVMMTPGSSSIPQVLSTAPADNAAGVPLRPTITATFSEAMDPTTLITAAFSAVETLSGAPVSGTVSANGMTATFVPSADLLANADYTVTISTAVRSAYGIPLAVNYVWVFRTMPPVPAVTATSPADGRSGVALNARITAAFSEAMDPATVNAGTFLVSGTAGSVTYNDAGRTATFTPSSRLAASTLYTATITTGAASSLGVPLAQDHVWSFTTGTAAAVDVTPPAFAGIDALAPVSLDSVQVSWLPATDDMTPAADIVYLVSQSTTSGVFPQLPTVVTAPGATRYVAGGLTPGTTYYFRVNARDAAGNVDTNTRQLWSLAPGYFVDTVSGSDGNTGSEAAPYKTITKALSMITPSNANPIGVYVAAGTYDRTSNNEVFPLQLRPFTEIFCRGAGHSSVIDATGSGADAVYGNAQAAIAECRIVPDAGRTGIDDRAGGPGGPAGKTAVSAVIIDGPALDAVVFSANSSVATSTISGAGRRGILVRDGRSTASGNAIRGKQTGIEIAANSDPTIEANMIENNGVGVMVAAAGGRPSVRDNIISNNVTGILVTAGAPLIHKNEVRTNIIAGNDVGIEVGGGMPTVSFNTVSSNNRGIVVSGGTPAIKSNSISCNAVVDLQVLENVQVEARSNSWDHVPPSASLAPCVAGTDICYSFDVTGVPLVTNSTLAARPCGP